MVTRCLAINQNLMLRGASALLCLLLTQTCFGRDWYMVLPDVGCSDLNAAVKLVPELKGLEKLETPQDMIKKLQEKYPDALLAPAYDFLWKEQSETGRNKAEREMYSHLTYENAYLLSSEAAKFELLLFSKELCRLLK